MPICPFVKAQWKAKPGTIHKYYNLGPDGYHAYAAELLAWCDAQPEYIRHLIHEFGAATVRKRSHLDYLDLYAALHHISQADARRATAARAKYGAAFDDIRI